MTTGIIHDQNMKQTEKHMGGCIAGFFHFFDRSHVVSSKRLCPKRLTSSATAESESGCISSVGSPVISSECDRSRPREPAKLVASPDRLMSGVPSTPPPATVQDAPARSSLAMSSFEFKDGLKSPLKLTRELPRLSLDSRLHPRGNRTTSPATGGVRYDDSIESAIDDGSETHRRSPSVVARLMGLEPLLPSSHSGAGDMLEKKVDRRRSTSETRSRDMLHCRFIEGNMLPENTTFHSSSRFATSGTREQSNGGRYLSNCNINNRLNRRELDDGGYAAPNSHPGPKLKPRRTIAQKQLRKGLYDYGDFFPEPKQTVSSIYGDVEKRLKMRGIEEPSQDLETLKQILEALQFKGLLHHSKPPVSQIGRRNFVYERRIPYEESPAIVMKPMRSPRRLSTEPSPPKFQLKTAPRRSLKVAGEESFSSLSPRRNPTSPGRSENRSMSPGTRRRKGVINTETQKRPNETTSTEARRVSPVQSPRMGTRSLDQTASQSPRRRRSTAEVRSRRTEDESSTVSESSLSISSRTDTEKSKMEECYKDGKGLLERCNKLLNSIAEMSSTSSNSAESQQSPVSVLDSSLYKEDESPSPVKKRAIDFKDMEDELWSPSNSDEDPDFAYVSEIIKATTHLPSHMDIFLFLEKKKSKGRNSSKSSILHRKLIFDTIIEILGRNKPLPPWKPVSCGHQLSGIWSEFQRIQKRDESEDMFDVICGVIKRDLDQDSINGWGECQLEFSETVLDVERLVYKDLIGEMIRDFMGFSGSCRKLAF